MKIVKNMNELIKELEYLNKEAKEYLDEYLENNDDEVKTIDEYQECFGYLDDLFQVRIYDLAQYNITKTLLEELKK